MSRIWPAPALAAFLLTVAASSVHAGGSIALGEALGQFEAPPALITELDAAVRKANTTRNDVICDAARFGRHWKFLGGGRASPYECTIGARTLVISGQHEYRDEAGNALHDSLPDLHEMAATHRDVNISWEWK